MSKPAAWKLFLTVFAVYTMMIWLAAQVAQMKGWIALSRMNIDMPLPFKVAHLTLATFYFYPLWLVPGGIWALGITQIEGEPLRLRVSLIATGILTLIPPLWVMALIAPMLKVNEALMAGG